METTTKCEYCGARVQTGTPLLWAACSDIVCATLAGAPDVVMAQNEDGSYLLSSGGNFIGDYPTRKAAREAAAKRGLPVPRPLN